MASVNDPSSVNFEPPDSVLLSRAVGWLELGNASEAEAELKQIAATLQEHPAVLDCRWQVHARREQWDQALAVAQLLVDRAPNNCTGWIHRAYALRRVAGGGLLAAQAALRPALERFPEEYVIPYNLGCYAAQLGRLDEAWEFVTRAMKLGGKARIKRMALDDPDLKELRDRFS